MKLPILLLSAILAVQTSPADRITLQKQSERNHVTATFEPKAQEVEQGSELRFTITYRFARSFRAMNIFALTHNHPVPTSELRFFMDGVFFATPVQTAFAGNFPDHEYLMYSDSSITFITTVSTSTKQRIFPNGLPPGEYQVQLAVYDKLSLGAWLKKDSEAKPVMFSNPVTCTISER